MIVTAVLLTVMTTSPDAKPVAPEDTTPRALLAAIERQRAELAAEKAEIAAARADLQRAEAQLDDKIKLLEKLVAERTEVEKGIIAARAIILDDRTKRLMEITQKMKPERAAAYLSGLDEQVAVSILEGMSVRKAALVISALPDSKTSKLSRLYLAREPRTNRKPDPKRDTEDAAP